MELQEALRFASVGQAVLFVGAGMSTEARNQAGHSIPTANALRDILASELGISNDAPLDIIADAFNQQRGTPALLNVLRNQFTAVSTSESHKKILSLPWHRIYTTNYDDAIELSLRSNSIQPNMFVRSEFPTHLPKGSVVHLKGFISQINTTNFSEELVLSLSQHLASDIFNTGWATLLRQDFQHAAAIMFVGYAFSDLDVSKVLYSDPRNVDKTLFLVEQDPHPAVRMRLAQFGELNPIGLSAFADRAIASKQSSKEFVREPILTNFRSSVADQTRAPQTPSAEQARNFLIKGAYDSSIYSDSIAHPAQGPLIFRNQMSDAKKYCTDTTTVLMVHSDSGNGKTIFCEMLDSELQRSGVRTFWYLRDRSNVF